MRNGSCKLRIINGKVVVETDENQKINVRPRVQLTTPKRVVPMVLTSVAPIAFSSTSFQVQNVVPTCSTNQSINHSINQFSRKDLSSRPLADLHTIPL